MIAIRQQIAVENRVEGPRKHLEGHHVGNAEHQARCQHQCQCDAQHSSGLAGKEQPQPQDKEFQRKIKKGLRIQKNQTVRNSEHHKHKHAGGHTREKCPRET